MGFITDDVREAYIFKKNAWWHRTEGVDEFCKDETIEGLVKDIAAAVVVKYKDHGFVDKVQVPTDKVTLAVENTLLCRKKLEEAVQKIEPNARVALVARQYGGGPRVTVYFHPVLR